MAKSVSHHARFRSILVSGGSRIRPQEDSLNNAIDMVVGTPGRILQHIEEGNMVYGDIAYLVCSLLCDLETLYVPMILELNKGAMRIFSYTGA